MLEFVLPYQAEFFPRDLEEIGVRWTLTVVPTKSAVLRTVEWLVETQVNSYTSTL